jgi:isopropylmalate/homocitrate/citramalate synthase
MKSLEILDSTLREGEQSSNIFFSDEQRKKLVELLDNIGISIIELGHPITSKKHSDRIKQLTRLNLDAETLAHARAKKDDIDQVVETGTDWVGIFAGVNELSIQNKYNLNRTELYSIITDSIAYAKDLGLNVRFTIEDATRTDLEDVLQIAKIAELSGADRISIADTVGISTPSKINQIITSVKSKVSIPLHIHCHNDLGLALANSLSAYDAGVSVIDVSVNGIGERAGITCMAELLTVLSEVYGIKQWELSNVYTISKLVEAYSGVKMDYMRPIVGANVFTHTADLHKKAVRRNPETYESISPSLFGRDRQFSIEKNAIDLKSYIKTPLVEDSSALKFHTAGPGCRSVLVDNRLFPSTNFYMIQRDVKNITGNEIQHVEKHIHTCNSAFVFLGECEELKKLYCDVTLGNQLMHVESPSVVFIPAGVEHSYQFIKGSGKFINIVLSNDYNSSIVQ